MTIRLTPPIRIIVRLESAGGAPLGVANEGFRGMGVKQGEAYNFSAQVRNVSGSPVLRIDLYSGDGEILDTVRIKDFSSDWKKYTAVLHPKDTDAKARLYVQIEGKGALDLDVISLFPEHTWKNRPGGLRADMVQALADLHPGFLRFPGGCIVEGSVLKNRYQWKNTIGPVEERPLLINRWNNEFSHRPTPDYYPVVRPRLLRIFSIVRRHRRVAAADFELRHGLPVQLRRVVPD